jgi:putative transposase
MPGNIARIMDIFPQRRRPHHEVRPASHRPTVVFVTVCTKNRRSILANAQVHDALIETWSKATAWLVGQYVIMPDHIHLFATPGPQPLPLENWIAFWKSRLARKLGTGVWQEGYWDRTLRNGESYAEKCEYVRDNPVRRGLVGDAKDWQFAGSLNDLSW